MPSSRCRSRANRNRNARKQVPPGGAWTSPKTHAAQQKRRPLASAGMPINGLNTETSSPTCVSPTCQPDRNLHAGQSLRVAEHCGCRWGKLGEHDRAAKRQSAYRALARHGPLAAGVWPSRGFEPMPGSLGRRGHPVHSCPRGRPWVLTLARGPVHRPVPAQQRPDRTG